MLFCFVFYSAWVNGHSFLSVTGTAWCVIALSFCLSLRSEGRGRGLGTEGWLALEGASLLLGARLETLLWKLLPHWGRRWGCGGLPRAPRPCLQPPSDLLSPQAPALHSSPGLDTTGECLLLFQAPGPVQGPLGMLSLNSLPTACRWNGASCIRPVPWTLQPVPLTTRATRKGGISAPQWVASSSV